MLITLTLLLAFASDDLVPRIDALLASYDRTDAPGCAIAVLRDGELILDRGYGRADLEHDVAIAPDTVFDIGSTSKQFTAAAIALLLSETAASEDRRLGLDDPVVKWIPELPAAVYGGVRIRHLLFHTSGVRDYLPLLMLDGRSDSDWTTAKDALAAIARQKGLCFEPGSRHEYSNSGYFLLAQVVERVSGKSMAQFARERFFLPLGMSDTHVHDDHTLVVKRRAIGYQPSASGFGIAMSDFEQTGDGAVMTTVLDLLKWSANFETGLVGGNVFLEHMTSRGALDDGTPLEYGFGLFHGKQGALDVISHGGAWAGYRADLLRVPSRRLVVVCLANRGDADPSGTVHEIARLALASDAEANKSVEPAEAPTQEFEPDDADLEACAGLWRCPADERTMTIARSGGTLSITGRGGARRLVPVARGAYRDDSVGVELAFDLATLPAQGLSLSRGASPADRFVRAEPWQPTIAELEPFAGSFRSDEVDARFEVKVEGGRLIAVGARGERSELRPTTADVFAGPGLYLRFERDEAGAVIAFSIRTRGIAGLRFTRLP